MLVSTSYTRMFICRCCPDNVIKVQSFTALHPVSVNCAGTFVVISQIVADSTSTSNADSTSTLNNNTYVPHVVTVVREELQWIVYIPTIVGYRPKCPNRHNRCKGSCLQPVCHTALTPPVNVDGVLNTRFNMWSRPTSSTGSRQAISDWPLSSRLGTILVTMPIWFCEHRHVSASSNVLDRELMLITSICSPTTVASAYSITAHYTPNESFSLTSCTSLPNWFDANIYGHFSVSSRLYDCLSLVLRWFLWSTTHCQSTQHRWLKYDHF